jgi:3-hydroxyisobutyrate dehydrogenase
MATVGLVGVGRMGRGMLKNLVVRGHTVRTHDVSPGAREEAARRGAQVVASVAEVGEGAEAVFVSVPGPSEVRRVVSAEGGLLTAMTRDSLILDTTTVDPETARAVSTEAERHGVVYFGAPVSGGAAGAEQGTLTFMIGGPQAHYDRARPFLECLGPNLFYVGDAGAGNVVKLCHQLLVYASLAALCEALTVGARAGLPPEPIADAILKGSAASHFLQQYAPKAAERRFDEVASPLSLAFKDMTLFLEMARACETPALLGASVEAFLRAAVAQGHGEQDMSALLQVFETLAGQPPNDQAR